LFNSLVLLLTNEHYYCTSKFKLNKIALFQSTRKSNQFISNTFIELTDATLTNFSISCFLYFCRVCTIRRTTASALDLHVARLLRISYPAESRRLS